MASVLITNLSSTETVYIQDLYDSLNPLEATTITRTNAELQGMYSLQALIAAGKVSVAVTPSTEENLFVTATAGAGTVLTANTNQSVDGIKTFVKSPIVPDPTTATQVANLETVVGLAIQKKTVRMDKTTDAATWSGAAGGVKTITKNVGTALPANARVIGAELILTEVVDNVGNTATAALKVGGTDDNGLIADVDVTTGGIGVGFFKGTGADAAVPFHSLSAQQIVAVITVTEDVNTLTKGDLTINIFYTVLA